MKKILAFVLAFAMIFALAACATQTNTDTSTETDTTTETDATTETETDADAEPDADAEGETSGELIKVGIINNDPNESGYRTANDADMKRVFCEENGYDASFYYSLKNDE